MLSLQSPGVYIDEIDSGVKPIEIAGTSTAAFLGFTRTGKTMVPEPIERYEEFASSFGGISSTGTDPADPMAFAVRLFFQNGGARAYVVNVAKAGSPAAANVTAGRNSSPVPMFEVKSRHNGMLAEGLVAYLTPKGGVDSGVFDFEIFEERDTAPRAMETYSSVTLAPGMAGSLEKVVENSDSRFTIKIDGALAPLVFPNVDLDTAVIRGATDLRIKVLGDPPLSLSVNWGADEQQANAAALNEAFGNAALPAGIQVKATPVGNSKMRVMAHSKVKEAILSLSDGTTQLGTPAKSRGELLKALIAGVTGSPGLKIAVLSGRFSFDSGRLSGHHLDVRFGSGFARRAGLGGLDRDATALDLTQRIAQALNTDAVAAAHRSLVYQVEDGRCRISIGPDAPAGASLTDVTPASGGAEPLFKTTDGVLQSARFIEGSPAMTVDYQHSGSWIHPQTVMFGSGQRIDDLVDALNELSISSSATTKLLEAEKMGKFGIRVKAKAANRPVRIQAVGDNSLAEVLGLATPGVPLVVDDSGFTDSNRVATKGDLNDIKLRLTETGADDSLDTDVDLTSTTLSIDTAAALATQVQATLESNPDGATTDARVELIKDRILIWDPGKNVAIVSPGGSGESGAALLGLTQATGAIVRPMNELQSGADPAIPPVAIAAAMTPGDSGTDGSLVDYRQALAELETLPEIAIICLPGHPWDKGTGSSYQVVEEAIAHARRQQDRMVIVDPPKPERDKRMWRDRGDVQGAKLPTSSYASIYYPWALVPVPAETLGGDTAPTKVLVAPSGIAAGVWSWMDRERGVWKAPAGVDARVYGVAEFQHELTDAEGGALNREGVNALRNLRGSGSVVWGARTAATNAEPQWKYLPVRRTAIMIEDSLRETLAWAVHQPNRPVLWAALRLNIEAFLERLFQAGAFQPDNARDAYFVQCGLGTTMSQADIDSGIVRVRIGFAPSKPAEFVVITIEQINEQG